MSDNFGVSSDPEIFEVEAIIDKKYENGLPYYLVKWKHYEDPSYNTWEPPENLENCDNLLSIFESSERCAEVDEEETLRKESEKKAISKKNKISKTGKKTGLSLSSKAGEKQTKSKKVEDDEFQPPKEIFISDSDSNEETKNQKTSKSYDSDIPEENSQINKKENQRNKTTKSRSSSNSFSSKQNQKQDEDQSTDISSLDSSSSDEIIPEKPKQTSNIKITKKTSSNTKTKTSTQKTISNPLPTPILSSTTKSKQTTTRQTNATQNKSQNQPESFTLEMSSAQSFSSNTQNKEKTQNPVKKQTTTTASPPPQKYDSDENDSSDDETDFSHVSSIVFSFKSRSDLKKCTMKKPNYKRLYGIPETMDLPASFQGEPIVSFNDLKLENSKKYVYAELKNGKKEWILLDVAKQIDNQLLLDFLLSKYASTK